MSCDDRRRSTVWDFLFLVYIFVLLLAVAAFWTHSFKRAPLATIIVTILVVIGACLIPDGRNISAGESNTFELTEQHYQEESPSFAAKEPQRPKVKPAPQNFVDTESEKRRAVALHPALAVANSPLNREFFARYWRYQANNKNYFNDPQWPVRLAEESQMAIGRR